MEEEEVVEALLFGDRETQVLCAKGITELTTKQKQKLAEKGVIQPLVSMLQTHDLDAIEAALLALLSLACGSERNKARIAKTEAVPALLKVLQWRNNDSSLLDLSIAALLILSSCTANKLSIAASGAIQILLSILNTNDAITIQAKLDTVSTLHNLSTNHQIIPSIVRSGTVFSLLKSIKLSEKSSVFVEKSMALLDHIVSSSNTALKEAAGTASGGGIQLLVEIIEEGSAQSKEYAVGILVAICESCRERYRGMILKEGGMAGLLQLRVDGTWRAKEKAEALLLLLRDSREKPLKKKNVMLERVMRKIDGGEKGGKALKMVEEMITKLRT